MDIVSQVLQRKAATVTLAELSKMCGAQNYSGLVACINGLVAEGLLRPMGKGTNGMYPPLRTRYRVARAEPAGAPEAAAEIKRLGPGFNPSGYLANIPLYIKHRELLRALRDYAQAKSGELASSMSKNERAYAIWGNEKQLDDAVCKNMLRHTGWDAKLNYYETPEPFLDYLCCGAETGTILILENKDIWFSLRKLFMEHGAAGGGFAPPSLYGWRIGGLLYGEGKKIARPGALGEYSKIGFHKPPVFYYWGDLDYEGIGIYLAVSKFPVRLFTPGYEAMLGFGKTQKLTKTRAAQAVPPGIGEFLANFGNGCAGEISALLAENYYIPQEICGYPRLRAAAGAAV